MQCPRCHRYLPEGYKFCPYDGEGTVDRVDSTRIRAEPTLQRDKLLAGRYRIRGFVGMGSIVMDNVVLGEHCFVAAGTLLPPGKVIPARSFVMGSPGRVLREVGERELEQIAFSWEHYRERMREWLAR